jgi:hypothetical protein
MRRRLAFALAAPLLAACTRAPPQEVPITASEVPASFAYGKVGPASARYRQARDPASGTDIRHMILDAPDEIAVVAVLTLTSQYVFTPTSFRQRLGGMLPDGQTVEWQDSLQSSGLHPTKIATFAMPDLPAQCVGMERGLKNHPEAPTSTYSQSIAIGFYCRPGAPFSADEAYAVAAALRTAG